MKKLILIIAVITNYSLTVKSQVVSLNQISNSDTIHHISAFSANYDFTFTTSNVHYRFINNSLDTIKTSNSGFNDIDKNNSAVGDTLSLSILATDTVYGTRYGDIYRNNYFVTNVGMEVRSLTQTDNYIYTIGKNGQNYVIISIMKIMGTVNTYPISQDVNQQDSIGSTFKEIQYFKASGGNFLFINNISYNNVKSYIIRELNTFLSPVNTPNSVLFNDAKSSSFYSYVDSAFYVSENNIIQKVDNANSVTLFTTNKYNVPLGITINDISSNNLTGTDFRIYAATTDGIYSNANNVNITIPSSTVGIEEKVNSENVNIFPNPNNGQFTLTNLTEETIVTIQNSYGQIIHSYENIGSSTLEVNIDMPAGFYFIRISNKNETQVLKVVIN